MQRLYAHIYLDYAQNGLKIPCDSKQIIRLRLPVSKAPSLLTQGGSNKKTRPRQGSATPAWAAISTIDRSIPQRNTTDHRLFSDVGDAGLPSPKRPDPTGAPKTARESPRP